MSDETNLKALFKKIHYIEYYFLLSTLKLIKCRR